MNWYDDYPHLGYDWEGKKIVKPNSEDQLDYFLKRMEDPNFWFVLIHLLTYDYLLLCNFTDLFGF